MILELNQIKELIKKPKNGDLISSAIDLNSKLAMHVNGVGTEEYIEELSGIESAQEKELRARLVRSNKGIFSTLLRPFDRVFSAGGGSVFYDVPDVNTFTNYLSDLNNGMGLRPWLKKRWKNKFIVDPNGVLLIENDSEGNPEPTYKAITTIHDYCQKGIHLDYIIFVPFGKGDKSFDAYDLKDGKNYYRVIDDEKDIIVESEGDYAMIVDELTIKVEIGMVPAVLCSDILDNESNGKASPIQDVIDIADEYLRDTSIHSVYKILHSYPVFWAYLPECTHCDGTGKVQGENEQDHTCPKCHGYKKDLRKDVSKIYALDPPNPDESSIAPPAGYVQPDVSSWTEQRTELDWLQRLMHFAMWGTHTREQATNETATGRYIDSQPVNDRLDDVSETAENIETALTDIIGWILYAQRYKGSSIGLGRRYMIESPEAIWKRYETARTNGAPLATLDYMLLQFYESEFKSQPMRYQVFEKLIYVEPFVHIKMEDIDGLPVEPQEKLKKYYFSEWLGTMEEGEILMTDTEKLRISLTDYVKQYEVVEPAPVEPAPAE